MDAYPVLPKTPVKTGGMPDPKTVVFVMDERSPKSVPKRPVSIVKVTDTELKKIARGVLSVSKNSPDLDLDELHLQRFQDGLKRFPKDNFMTYGQVLKIIQDDYPDLLLP